MASRVMNIPTFSWHAKEPIGNATEKSANFSLLNADWYLELSCEYNYPNRRYEYNLYMLQNREKENLLKPFWVTVLCGSLCDSADVKGYNKLVKFTKEVIYTFYNFFNEIDVLCIFHDLAPSEITSLDPGLDSLTLDFSNLLKDQTLADAKLRCGNETVPVHKTVLSARSVVFAAMFRNKMSEKLTGVIELKDLDAEVLQLFLRYVYTGQVPNVPDDMVPALYAAGVKYAVHALKKSCSDRMIGWLTEENWDEVLILADAHADADFKRQVLSFISQHEEILLGNTWLKFSENNMSLALEVYHQFAQNKIAIRT